MERETTAEIRKVTKEEWIDALWSGEYRQFRGGLGSLAQGSYCCLGVLADLAGFEWSHSWSEEDESGYLPERICQAIGMDWLTSDVQHDLSALNDDEGQSFREIGEYLKELPH
jgi:hypothetical protein